MTRASEPPESTAAAKPIVPNAAERATKKAAPVANATAATKATPPKRTTPAKKAAPADKTAPARRAAPAPRATAAKTAPPAKKALPKPLPVKKAAPAADSPVEKPSAAPWTPPQLHVVPPPAEPVAAEPALATAGGTGETQGREEPGPDRQPAAEVRPVTALRVVAARQDRRRSDSIGEQLLAEPARTPEILAHALVQTLGPRARAWAGDVRSMYPTASREALARLATQRFTRSAGLRGGAGALAGPYAPIALGAATVITHAEMVLHLAAVHGLDPTDPERAADLLRLVSPGVGPVVGWAALSLATPGVRLLAGFLSARVTTEMVAVRARRYYAQLDGEPGQPGVGE
ncbi:hypothetical protein [Actinoplanes sp. CA-252034]|uniref:hypothetical protein n=1 Tax=Actinoplanes sp. CA-252034 TaxID=3239906 RepID=UPI003D967E53